MRHLKFFVFLCILTFTVSCGQQKKYVQYKVKEGETMRLIANKLDMRTQDLLRLNPDVSRKPEANTVIIVPNKKMVSIIIDGNKKDSSKDISPEKEKKEDIVNAIDDKELQRNLLIEKLEKEFKIHEVAKGDTFFSLTRFYNVTRDELIELNLELSEGLKLGQLIKIMPIEDVFEDDNFLYKDEIKDGISIKAAIMLPFRASELDTLSSDAIFDNSKLANIVTDFYLGAEIAIDSLRRQGIQLHIDVYDTGRNSSKIRSIIEENDLDDNDVIIGPLYSEEVQYLAGKVKTPVVFPVYSKKQANFTGRRIVKTSPNKNLFRDKLLEYIEENFHDGNIVIVGDGQGDSNYNSKRIEKILESSDSISGVSIIIPENGYIKKQKFLDVLKPDMKNIVVMTTDDNVIVASAINSLISLPEFVSARVFTFDKVSAFNKVDNAKLAQLGFTYVSDEYIREDSFKSRTFNRKYLRKNGVLPSFYATKGFDITYDILMRLASGKSLKSTFDEGYSYRVESKFDYTDKLFKITENKGLFLVKYNPDLTLTRIK
ncbi:LysM peptidoglycan-binding domain-containing protein [uncultured Polaribacter sp.]|uniref:LysM peptidoglycan-binding domain-containing protein n=1 Tax=uncultured Polaribacter sp. TaxID=174711 RepID=UPI00260344D4|nr:LysM peptidoglycan-binding domain-containing protein [uncultured Polaribacter sp.]